MYNVWWSGIELGLQKQIVRVYWNGKLIFFFWSIYSLRHVPGAFTQRRWFDGASW